MTAPAVHPHTGKVNFGWNLIPETLGTIRAGDAVEVVDRAAAPALGGGG